MKAKPKMKAGKPALPPAFLKGKAADVAPMKGAAPMPAKGKKKPAGAKSMRGVAI